MVEKSWGYLKDRQKYYSYVNKGHELYIDDSDIRKVTDDLKISVQWKVNTKFSIFKS